MGGDVDVNPGAAARRLASLRQREERRCIYCGQPFLAIKGRKRDVCSNLCYTRSRRAAKGIPAPPPGTPPRGRRPPAAGVAPEGE
jgi:hypothetical protein